MRFQSKISIGKTSKHFKENNMIDNALELSRFLCEQARNSDVANAGIVIILDKNGGLHKSEFGLTISVPNKEKFVEMIAAPDAENNETTEQKQESETEDKK